jgi:cation:H+ antiporter
MVAGLGLLAVSAVLLVAGAELFAEHAAAAARVLGITVFGAAVLQAGAEPEELITAVIASGRHRPGLAAGHAIGANLIMLTLVLGLAALASPVAVPRPGPRLCAVVRAGRRAGRAGRCGAQHRALAGRAAGGGLPGRGGAAVVARAPADLIGEAAEDADEDGSRPVLGLALALGGVALMAAGGSSRWAGPSGWSRR